ncbi:hypothetical protein PDK11_14250 [Bacillus cereus]|nr:hypothetical protein [Bacillus cereus]
MTNVQKERFNARNITKADTERANKIIRERDYNYKVDLNILYTLRSLINDEIRDAENKREAFYKAMQRHDTRVLKRQEDFAPINIGGWPIYRYLEVLRKVKSLGGTEFDEYWNEDQA